MEFKDKSERLLHEIWCQCRYKCLKVVSSVYIEDQYHLEFEVTSEDKYLWQISEEEINSGCYGDVIYDWSHFLVKEDNQELFMLSAMHGVKPDQVIFHSFCEECEKMSKIIEIRIKKGYDLESIIRSKHVKP